MSEGEVHPAVRTAWFDFTSEKRDVKCVVCGRKFPAETMVATNGDSSWCYPPCREAV